MIMKKSISKIVESYINGQNNINSNFWNWFGQSKVVDENDNPIICYHGTPKGGFTKFIPSSGQKKKASNKQIDFGTHFTKDKEYASSYIGNKKTSKVYEVYLKIENPLYLNKMVYKNDENFEQYLGAMKQLMKYKKEKIKGDYYYDRDGNKHPDIQYAIITNFGFDEIPVYKMYNILTEWGFDGIFYKPYNSVNLNYFNVHPQSYVVLNPNQIKAVTNDGSWDTDDDDIYS